MYKLNPTNGTTIDSNPKIDVPFDTLKCSRLDTFMEENLWKAGSNWNIDKYEGLIENVEDHDRYEE